MKSSKAIFFWSGGKDSAYCLHKVLKEKLFDIEYLLTTVNDNYKRVSMHGVREELLEAQAKSIGIPLLKVGVIEGTNNEYERLIKETLLKAKSKDIYNVIYGDIFLEDLRVYREDFLSKIGMQGIFPIWNINTFELINDFIKQKFKSIICCTNDGYLGKEWLGREIDESFVQKLPNNCDPCGENGEYHTFCYDGPLFKERINLKVGKRIYKRLEIKDKENLQTTNQLKTQGFWFCDLLSK